jgi:hypothetical protein
VSWTHDPPAEPGWYWKREVYRMDSDDVGPMRPVRVVKQDDGQLYEATAYSASTVRAARWDFQWWSEPIKEPTP